MKKETLRAWLIFLAISGIAASRCEAAAFLTEKVRAGAEQPTKWILSGAYSGFFPKEIRQIEVTTSEGEPERIVLELGGDTTNPGTALPFALEAEFPPLSVGGHRVQIVYYPPGSPTLSELETLAVAIRYPVSYAIERVDPAIEDTFRLRIAGQSAFGTALLDGPPRVEGSRIVVPISIGCELDCVVDPAPIEPWELLTEAIGPLDGGTYTLEIRTATRDAADSKIAVRDEIFIADEALVRDGRFAIQIRLDSPLTERPRLVAPPTTDSALFYFFSPDNWETMVKVLDGCAINGYFWVFAASSTDVGYTLEVTDRAPGGTSVSYRHEAGSPAPAITDTGAFACN